MKRHRNSIKNIDNTGFTALSNVEGSRITNKDGSINIQKSGLRFWEQISLYHSLLQMQRGKLLLSIFLFYGCVNVFFAFIYMLIGVDNLIGGNGEQMHGFLQAFFFSSQTLTTVGYGHISPTGIATNIVASLESFIGILSFAMVTGLLFGRFTRPKAYLMFSDNVIISPHKGIKALMFRIASYKNNHLTEVEAQLTIAFHMKENGSRVTKFYPLKLEINKINSLALSWTLVHLIDEESPLFGMSFEEMKETNFELLVFVKGFDDHFSNTVQQRSSYTINEIVYGAKFLPMFKRSDDGSVTVLKLDKINAYEMVEV